MENTPDQKPQKESFSDWIKGKVLVLACGCQTQFGATPLDGWVKRCSTHTNFESNKGTGGIK